MAKRHPNPRLAKIHRSYTVEEISQLYLVHKNTVRAWIKSGLAPLDDMRPMLILGSDLREFLHRRRARSKQSCRPGEIYCVGCRAPRFPAENKADFLPLNGDLGNLVGICPACHKRMFRRANLPKLGLVCGDLDVTIRQAKRHIDESPKPSQNCDFKMEPAPYAQAQPQ